MKMPVIIFLWLAWACTWLTNVYEVTQCDFDAPYKCEVIHTVGIVIPPASIITVWFDTDSK